MTLYRINDTSKGGERVLTVDEIIALELMLGAGALVPVEPCEHGHYDAHQTPNVNPSIGWDDYRRCPGAGIGGSDAG